MGNKINIKSGEIEVTAELNDSETAAAVWEALPVSSTVKTWGEEIYFEIPVEKEASPDARAEVKVGEMGYWSTGKALCLFFGPTPASQGSEPRAASPVNPVGFISNDPAPLKKVTNGARIVVTRKDSLILHKITGEKL